MPDGGHRAAIRANDGLAGRGSLIVGPRVVIDSNHGSALLDHHRGLCLAVEVHTNAFVSLFIGVGAVASSFWRCRRAFRRAGRGVLGPPPARYSFCGRSPFAGSIIIVMRSTCRVRPAIR